MIPQTVGLLVSAVAAWFAGSAGAPDACECPCARPQADAPGTSVPFPVPLPEAFAHNRAGYALYRQRRFAEARTAYQAARVADPSFLAPGLNIACALVQEERFSDAVSEAIHLLQAGFVPWAHEIEEAADLAPLRIHAEARRLRDAHAAAGPAWGAPLLGPVPALLFVARNAPPVALNGTGVLVLAPAQEVIAYLPAHGRYRQVTAEDGRVLALARSRDGKSVVYVRGSKVLRDPQRPDRLRGLMLRRLDLAQMHLGPAVAVPGDVVTLSVGFVGEGTDHVAVETAVEGGTRALYTFDGAALLPAPPPAHDRDGHPEGKRQRAPRGAAAARTVLTAAGVDPAAMAPPIDIATGCAFTARNETPRGAASGVPRVVIRGTRGQPFPLTAPHGAGLLGLPFASSRADRANPARPLR